MYIHKKFDTIAEITDLYAPVENKIGNAYYPN